jgi:hypothetical protein
VSRLPRLGTPDMAAWFANGRSPACWQRQMARAVKKQADLAQVCARVDEVAQPPSPALRRGPLFGSCLAELVAPTAADAPPPTGEPSEARRQSAPAPRPTTGQRPFPSPHPTHRQPLPTQPVRARSELLQRWAGKTAVTPPGQPSASRPATANAPSGLPASSQKLPAPSNKRPLPGDRQNAPMWTTEMVKRIREQFAPGATAVTQPTSMASITHFKGHRSANALPLEKPVANLGASWQQSLNGPSAPLALLERLQAPTLPAADMQTTPKPTRPSGAAPVNRPARLTTGAFEALAHGQANTAQSPLPPHDRQGRPSPATHHQAQTAVATAPPPQPDDADDGWFEAPRFAPPQMAESLPRLRPLPRPGTLSLSPIAAATAERSARREAEAAPEDLDALARQLKQILDEESRRHGINV